MRPNLFHTRAATPSTRLLIAFSVLLVVALVAILEQAGPAGATISEKRDKLADVQNKKSDISAQIADSNADINALVGKVSAARQAEEAAAAELAAAEADLTAAQGELADGREHLADVRAQLDRMVAELEKILVGIYKSDDPDMTKLLLDASDWEDGSIDAAYLNRIRDYQESVVEKVRDLRNEAETTVDRLAEAKEQIEATRDSISQRHDELAATRASLESQEAELAAARAVRKDTLSRLAGREVELEDGIEAAERSAQREAQAPVPPPEPEVDTSDVASPPVEAPSPAPSGGTATLNSDGSATPPADAPPQVAAAIEAANEIRDMPYVWGGGHGSFDDSGYDCSGAVSYALHGGGFLSSPLDSTGLSYWGESGAGNWITVYANSGHTYVVIAGLRWDTSGTDGSGPSWSTSLDGYLEPSAYTTRHPAGF